MSEDYKKGYREGFTDGFKQGKQSAPYVISPQPIQPSKPWDNNPNVWTCNVCKMDTRRMMNYVCPRTNCPSKMHWTNGTSTTMAGNDEAS